MTDRLTPPLSACGLFSPTCREEPMTLSPKTLAVLRGPVNFAIWHALADVAVKAAELRALETAYQQACVDGDAPNSLAFERRFEAIEEALDASLATLEAEAARHG